MTTQDDYTISFGGLVRAFWFLVRHSRRRYALWFFVLVLVHASVLLPPLVLGRLVDFLSSYQNGESLYPLYLYAGLVGAALCSAAVIRLSAKRRLGDMRSKAIYHARVEAFEKLIDLSLNWDTRESSGSRVQRVQNGTVAFERFARLLDNELVLALAAACGSIAVFLVLEPKYVLFYLLYILSFGAILRASYRRISALNVSWSKAHERAVGTTVEGLTNALTLRAAGVSGRFVEHLARQEQESLEHDNAIRAAYTSQWKLFQIFNGLCYAAFLFAVGRDVVLGLVSVGAVVVSFGYLQNLVRSASDFMSIYEDLLRAKTAIGRMMPILTREPAQTPGLKPMPEDWQVIRLEDCCYQYPGKDEEVLSGISLEIRRGECFGISGPSGSGKSTLARLLMGILPLKSGSYRIRDTEFSEIEHQAVLENFAIVLQEPEMFNLTIRDNITLFRELDEERLAAALSLARLDELVGSLSQGLNTLIGEKGYQLSGGERQRIGIARAVYRDPQILILDEATSSLDNETEAQIYAALRERFHQKTMISIGHRPAALNFADRHYLFRCKQAA